MDEKLVIYEVALSGWVQPSLFDLVPYTVMTPGNMIGLAEVGASCLPSEKSVFTHGHGTLRPCEGWE